MTDTNNLAGRRLLVVEDEYFLAADLAARFRAEGASVIGPAASVEDAMNLIEAGGPIDCAVLDLNLQGEQAFPVADRLLERSVPFIFTTGYDRSAIPARFSGITHCEKPVDAVSVVQALLG